MWVKSTVSEYPTAVKQWPINDPEVHSYNANSHIVQLEPPIYSDFEQSLVNYEVAIGGEANDGGMRRLHAGDWKTVCRFKLYSRGYPSGDLIYSGFDVVWEYKFDRFETTSSVDTWWHHLRMIKLNTVNGDRVQIGSEITNARTRQLKFGIPTNVVGTNYGAQGMLLAKGEYNDEPFIAIGISDYIGLKIKLYDWSSGSWRVDSGSSFYGLGFSKIDGLEVDPKEYDDPNEPLPPDPDDPDPDGPAGPGGGGGDHDKTPDPVPVPPLPGLSATDAGFITLYNPSLQQMQAIAAEVYTDTIWEAISNFFKSPSDYIVGLGIVPVQPVVGNSAHPKCGIFTFNTALPIITQQYMEVNCGAIDIKEFYGSAFDYSGMTTISLYLPYIGYRDLDVDGAMARTVGVIYHVDVYNGNCVALVTINGDVHYHFSGNCMQQVPTASQSFDNAIACGITLAAAVVGAVATGGASAAEEAATGGAEMLAAGGEAAAKESAIASASSNAVIGSSMVNVMNSKPNVSRSGAIGSSSGMMGVQYPYIIKKIPRQSWPNNYNEYAGYPCNMTAIIGSLSGFTVVDSIKLSGVPATEEELTEIMAYLKGGVFI